MELEKKECKCGCGKTWRAMSTSQNKFYSYAHSQYWRFKVSQASDREPHAWRMMDKLLFMSQKEKYGKLL